LLRLLTAGHGTKLPFATAQNYVCFLGYSGREMLALRLSHFDIRARAISRCTHSVGASERLSRQKHTRTSFLNFVTRKSGPFGKMDAR
jgi:hypothetical protein